jgi:hypothetical protein
MPSLFDVFRMVLSRAGLVGIGVRKLGADPFRVVTDFIQGGGDRGAYAVSCECSLYPIRFSAPLSVFSLIRSVRALRCERR